MNIYLISQDTNRNYDTFDAAVVTATSAEKARKMHPRGEGRHSRDDWTQPDKVTVELLGKALKGTEESVVLSSYNAG